MEGVDVPEFLQPTGLGFTLLDLFDRHVDALQDAKRQRREALQLQSVAVACSRAAAGAAAVGELGEARASDVFAGDAAMRTMHRLLAMIDDRGFARSSQQLSFHSAFIRATARVIYRDDWAKSQPRIMEINKWDSTPSEVLVSTPRRFGKTFS